MRLLRNTLSSSWMVLSLYSSCRFHVHVRSGCGTPYPRCIISKFSGRDQSERNSALKTFRFLLLGLLVAASFSVAHSAVALALSDRPVVRICTDDGSCDSSGNRLGCRVIGTFRCTCDLIPFPVIVEELGDETGFVIESPYYCRGY